MASDRVNVGIEELLRAARRHDAEGQTDGQLLGQFLTKRDEAAFAALVKRHGPMVLGVCRRILGNVHDAEDAFQAAFLVLVRKAASLTSRAVLGDWLHGVARRTALNAKRVAARRRQKEAAMARPETQSEECPDDRLILLDEVLRRLPEKYRLAIVLCELEGHTRREAAAQLGWPEGTVAGRLTRGRELLAKRLLQHGLAVSATSMTAGLFGDSASASVPMSLAFSTMKAAMQIAAGQAATTGAISASVAALAEGVLQSMFLNKLKMAAAVLLTAALLAAGGTVGTLAYQDKADKSQTGQQPAAAKSEKVRAEPPPQKKQAQPVADKKANPPPEADEEDRIRPGDVLKIRLTGTPSPNNGGVEEGIYQVERSGKVALGFGFGRLNVKGLTLEEAELAIHKELKKVLRNPGVLVTRPIPDNPALERRVRDLEDEVRKLRSLFEDLLKK